MNPRNPRISTERTPGSRFFACVLAFTFWTAGAMAQAPQSEQRPVINDVTQLNPIVVASVITPHSVEEIITVVKTASGPVSIGGGRFSMGGQTATDNALQLDMREFRQVLNFSAEQKEITVQSGATWRQIQEYIDPYNLSVKIMQTYSNFTVGGSLSVNVHGRYIGQGPLALSVRKIGLVLADGSYLHVSPSDRPDLFYGAIGGYGGIGVITDATLTLADNVKVHRESKVMPLAEYKDYFFREVRNQPAVLYHNADIYPDAYDTVRATSFTETSLPLSRQERLIPKEQSYWLDHLLMALISSAPGGKVFRQHIVDPILFSDDYVSWRNYESSYSVLELEPASRKDSTYVLQEYFVPVEKFDDFVPQMATILNKHGVNVINISVRHAKQDPGSLLAWAKEEVFAFVLYYKQDTSVEAREKVGVWTRELIDAAIASGGRYYLPYQIHATPAQFKAAYPGWEKFFTLKQAVDPGNKFRNKLWDTYYQGQGSEAVAPGEMPSTVRAFTSTLKDYRQDEGQTFLTMPEWFLVYSPDEYARYIKQNEPSGYPYFGAIGQFWDYYSDAAKAASPYPFNLGYHAMVSVIGTSFTVENTIKGIYENSVGHLSELTVRGREKTAEDLYGIDAAQDYVSFIRIRPWYEYGFWSRFTGLWSDTPPSGSNMIRKYERKFALSAEYLVKAAYGGVIKLATKAAYGDAGEKVYAIVRDLPLSPTFTSGKIKLLQRFENGYAVVSLPRYEEFMRATNALVAAGATFVEIAGNKKIFATVLARDDWQVSGEAGKALYAKPILTDTHLKRVGLELDVTRLHRTLPFLQREGVTLEHLYDY